MDIEQQQRQEALYSFPYHYIPTIDSDGIPRVTRSLSWGIDYLTYMEVIKEEIAGVLRPGGSLLDIGCGDGYLLNSLGPGIQKLGVDLSTRAIGFATAFATDAVFEARDFSGLEIEYDVVTCIEVLEHIPDAAISQFVARMLERVKEGGYLIVSVPTTVVKLNPKHYRHYDEALLSEHLEIDECLALQREIRVYKVSWTLRFLTRVLHNKLWTVNAPLILRNFWRWHSRRNRIADRHNGAHLLRVYKKK
jgi:SAM-dependent methyltransferase